MNYAIEQRLRFIDFLLSQYGAINRSALTDYFGVSQPQASLDIRAYMELAPENMAYNKTAKAYLVCDGFKRVYA